MQHFRIELESWKRDLDGAVPSTDIERLKHGVETRLQKAHDQVQSFVVARPNCAKLGRKSYPAEYQTYVRLLQHYLTGLNAENLDLRRRLHHFDTQRKQLHAIGEKEPREARSVDDFRNLLTSRGNRGSEFSALQNTFGEICELFERIKEAIKEREHELDTARQHEEALEETLSSSIRELGKMFESTHDWTEEIEEVEYPGMDKDDPRIVPKLIGRRCRQCEFEEPEEGRPLWPTTQAATPGKAPP